MTFRRGDTVRIHTVDGGKGPSANNLTRRPKTVAWSGIVLGPSVLGADLWLIKARGATYTVPLREIITKGTGQ